MKILKLNGELKYVFETNDVLFYLNGNEIDGKLSLTKNNIKDGDTITISKLINKQRLRVSNLAILNENENENYNESENAFNRTEKIENKDIKYKNEKLMSELEYRELNEIYKNELSDENFLIEKIINKEYLKEKDDKINEKNIWLIYNESYNSQFWKIP